MPKESTNLKLKLYNAVTDAKELAVNWYNNIFDYSNSNWTKIDDAYKEISDKFDNYIEKDGTGATGSWDIDISGNSNSATNDSSGQRIDSTYIKDISFKNNNISFVKGDNSNITLSDNIITDKDFATQEKAGIVFPGVGMSVDNTGIISVTTDKTFTKSNIPADAEEVGNALENRYTKEEADNKFGTPYTLPVATSTTLGGIKIGDGLDANEDGEMHLIPATTTAIGGVKIGSGLNVLEDGTISVSNDTGGLSAYPIGSIYQSVSSISPAALFGGTWEKIAQNRVLMGESDTHAAGTTVEAGLPNITGSTRLSSTASILRGSIADDPSYITGCFHIGAPRSPTTALDSSVSGYDLLFDASFSNAVYGASDTVQPAAYYVHIWERIGYLLNIYAEEGTALTITDGNVTIEDVVDDARRYSRELPDTGTWTVTAVKNGVAGTETLNVRSYGVFTLDFTFEVFGVVWDYSSSSTALTRLTRESDPYSLVTTDITAEPAAAVGTGAGSSPFDSYMPWSGMEEYNIVDNAVGPKYGETGFSRTDNDTMVYIPEFFYRVVDDAVNKKRYFYISDKKYSGFEKHPGSGKYIGRYHTISGYYSKSKTGILNNIKRDTARTGAKSKGENWSLYDYAAWCAVGLLYLVEYADWNSQSKVGRGYCDSNKTPIPAGGTDSMIYHTGRAFGTDGKTAVQYRHIENPWGNIYQWIDGINFNDSTVYVCTDPSEYADDTSTGYTNVGTKATSAGYISALGMSPTASWAIYPEATSGGSATTYVPDYSYSSTGWRVLYAGGYWADGSRFGLFCFNSSGASSHIADGIGARLQFNP